MTAPADSSQPKLESREAMKPPNQRWQEANHRYVTAELRRLARRLARRGAVDALEAADAAIEREVADAVSALPGPSALDILQTNFGLTAFERELVLLCAGFELDAELAEHHGPPTFALALAALPEPHWSALTPARPVRHYRLVEVQGGSTLVSSTLRIDERILHYLTGVSGVDARLEGMIEVLAPPAELVRSHDLVAGAIVDTWDASAWPPAVIELWGANADARCASAAAACDRLGLQLYRLALDGLGRELDERQLVRLLTREALLDRVALFIDGDAAEPGDAGMHGLARRMAERVHAPIVLAGRDRGRRLQRPSIAIEVVRPTLAEQRTLFRDALVAEQLGDRPDAARGIDRVVSQFDLGASEIRTVCAAARRRGGGDLGDALWDTCRAQARAQLEQLAQRIDARVGWSDLAVSAAQRQTLQDISTRVRQRTCVYDTWGFADKGARGLGITALFAGPSGTGKTLAAEVLACELRLDLYRIDLSHVVSKYIGETERNLGRVFDAAEQGAAILLFDEADALFGKRSEVKDSHDRYANIEIGYLLQRMEAYRGLAILTTNFREALDHAFIRRLSFVVEFAMPDAAMRGAIWRGVFPATTPTDGLDFDQLARLSLSGGNIRNIALAAAFLAADAGGPVRMAHVVAAARGEYGKLERPLPSELARL
jgi:ATPase family associated with various cellular activities (AAA)